MVLMSLANAIRDKVISYLSGEISLDELEDWVVTRTWDVDKTGDWEGADLAHGIELLLAEYTNGHRSEEELREQFHAMLSTIHVSTGGSPYEPRIITGTSWVITEHEPTIIGPALQWQPASIERGAGSG